MSEKLDFAVAQALFKARQVERALHDSGPWTMQWGGHTVPACRLIGKSEITFLAHFPERTAVPIEMTGGLTAWVSACDADKVSGYSWSAGQRGGRIYPQAKINDKTVLMHSLLIGVPDGQCVDHVDGDTLDNRRHNLRLATKSQNGANRGKPASNTSGYKGVSWHKASQKWKAQITVNGQTIYLGVHSTPEAASLAYDEAALEHFGPYALPNVKPDPTVMLLCDEEVVGSRPIDFPGDQGFQVEWRLAVEQPALV